MAEVAYYTKEGIERLKEEITTIKNFGQGQYCQSHCRSYRDKGDLSENAEYDAAKEAQGHHESKIAKMEELLSTARLLDESKLDSSKVLALSIVNDKKHQKRCNHELPAGIRKRSRPEIG